MKEEVVMNEKEMYNIDILTIVRRHLFFSFSMSEKLIDICPDGLWYETHTGLPFWQQLFHTSSGIDYWMRVKEDYIESFSDKKLYPELDNIPEDTLLKKELKDYKKHIRKRCYAFFDAMPQTLLRQTIVDNAVTHLDIVFMQICHMQYHVQ
jgi:hypothetical protein